jgi:thiosulfate/3-mercaptopyruvate sulfurtransferase
MGPLVDAAWLSTRLETVAVVDCRYTLGRPGAGEEGYLAGHVPGAAFLDVDRDLAAPPGERGRHPLPSPTEFERAARRAGIGAGGHVVAYDEAGEGGAARLWWLLRHFGHPRVSVLDGGLDAWRSAGLPLAQGREEVAPGEFRARAREGDTVEAEDLLAGDQVVLDARAPERFRGELEPIDPVAGHIPGARNAPFTELAAGGAFLPPDELRERLERAGAAPDSELVAYCGSGVTACTLVLAAELSGLGPARLYPGSWSEWCARGYPAARQDSARSTDSRSSGPGGVRSR